MSSTEPPTTQVPQSAEPPPPPRRSWWSRLTSRVAVITAAIVGLVIITGAAAALLLPDDDRERFGSGSGRPGWGGMDERSWRGGSWGEDGPGRSGDREWDEGRGPLGMGDDPIVPGTVASVASGSIVVNVDGAGPRTLRTDGDTEVFGATNSGLGDLQTGERVVVEVEGTGDTATAESVWTPQARVTGTVTTLAGDTATVISVDGLVVTADVAALSQRPTVGDVVVLTGNAVDGSTIRADGIRVLPRAP